MRRMSHLIVADGHYCGAEGETQRWRTLLDAAQTAGVDEISILGDFFELWIGLEGLFAGWQQALFEPLRRAKQAGCRLRYVVGNKDYFVESWNQREALFDEVADPSCVVDSVAGQLHLAHGDLVNQADRQYRAWRAVSRGGPLPWLVRALPRRFVGRRAERVAERMKATNLRHKSYFPEDQLRGRARELCARSATLVFGHFHQYRVIREGDKTVVTLPFLGTENAGVLVTAEGLKRFAA